MPFTALLVDDEPLAREGLRILLARDPDVSAIHEAKDGREAVEAIRTVRPDLVFLDVQMPEMDGFAVVQEWAPSRCRRSSSSPRTTNTPFRRSRSMPSITCSSR